MIESSNMHFYSGNHAIHNDADTCFEFEIFSDSGGSPVLSITQRYVNGMEISRQRLAISEASFSEFHKAYLKAAEQMAGSRRAYTVDEKRSKHVHAYKKWTQEDDAELTAQYQVGKSIYELSQLFGRNTSAIRSRLSKLGLLPLHKETAW